ncbi:hypothetical protein [uncultured Roseovarius sp.]|uniref:hypothetical protein n=1 Tax=uncultured Roseovarius sp. TaxID=293344 RepID=UPI0025DB71BF|nr:hypothetical protein [uncultured Roseovarius sp.]
MNIGVAAAGGLYAGIAGAVTVSLIDSDATARIGQNAMINTRNALTSDSAQQGVYVGASNDASMIDAAGSVAGGIAGLAGAVSFGTMKNDVNASVGAGTVLNTKTDLSVNALAKRTLEGFTISGAGGVVGLAASINVWSIGEDFGSVYDDSESENTDGANASTSQDALNNEDDSKNASTETQGNVDDTSDDINDGLSSMDDSTTSGDIEENSADDRAGKMLKSTALKLGEDENSFTGSDMGSALTAAAAGPQRGVNAIVESGVIVNAGDDVNVDASEEITVKVVDGAVAVGFVGAGGAVAVLNVTSKVQAKLGGTITAQGDITVDGYGMRDINYTAFVGTGGIAALGAAVTVINDNSTLLAEVSDNSIIRDANSLSVTAETDQDFKSETVGVAVGGAAVGAAFSKIRADDGDANTIETHARIGHNVDIGLSTEEPGAPGEDPVTVDHEVGDITVKAISTVDFDVDLTAGSAGIVAGSFNFVYVDNTSRVRAEIGNDVEIDSDGQIVVLAQASHKADVEIIGVTGGLAAAGVTLGRAKFDSDVRARVGNNLESDSEGLDVIALYNHHRLADGTIVEDAGRGVFVDTGAGGGGLFSGQGSVPTAEDTTDVVAEITADANPATSGAINTGAGDVLVDAHGAFYTEANAFAFSIGVVAAGASIATAKSRGSVKARMNGDITGGQNVTIQAVAVSDAIASAEAAGGGLIEATIPISHAESKPVIEASIGADATTTVNGDIKVNAVSDGNADASGSAKAGSLVGVGSMEVTSVVSPTLSAFVGSGATISGATLDINAQHNFEVAAGRKSKAYSEAGKASLLGFQFTEARAIASATLDSYLDGDADVTLDGALTISAKGVNDADADVESLTVGIILSVGETDTYAEANGSAKAGIKASASSSATPKIQVGGIGIVATTSDTANAKTVAASGGLITSSANSAVAYANSKEDSSDWDPLSNDDSDFTRDPNYVAAKAYIGSNSAILVTDDNGGSGDISLTAGAKPQADAYTKGATGGAVDIAGGSFAVARLEPVVLATIDSGAVIDAEGSVSLDATATPGTGVVPTFGIDGISVDDDTLTVVAHGLETGQIVEYVDDGGVIGGLDPYVTETVLDSNGVETTENFNREYAVIVVDADTIAFGAEFDGATINPLTEEITFESEHGFLAGDKVIYRDGGTELPGLTDGNPYYVILVDALTIKLTTDQAIALNPESAYKSFLPSSVDDIGDAAATEDNTIFGFTHGFSDDQAVTYEAPEALIFTDRQVDVDQSNTISGGYLNLSTVDNDYIRFSINDGSTDEGKPFSHGLEDNDLVLYRVEFVDDSTSPVDENGNDLPGFTDPGATPIGGLTNNTLYRVVKVNDSTIALKRAFAENVSVYYDNDGSSDRIIRDDGGSWIDDGFKAGEDIIITGSNGNDDTYTISTISDSEIVLTGNLSYFNRVEQSMTLGYEEISMTDYVTLTLGGGTQWNDVSSFTVGQTIELAGLPLGGTATIDAINGDTIRLSRTDASLAVGPHAGAIVQATTADSDTFDTEIISLTPDKGFPFDDLSTANDNDPGNATDPGNSDIHSLIRLADLPLQYNDGGLVDLVDGQTYYVDLVSATEFGLSLTPGGARLDLVANADGVTNHRLGAVAEDISVGTGNHSLTIDLTSFASGGTLLGPGGVPLSLFAPQSGDGISSATAKGSSGAIIGVKQNRAELTSTSSATAAINADLVRAGDDVIINSLADVHQTVSTTNGSGGLVAVGNVDSRTTTVLTSLSTIGANTQVVAGNDLRITAGADANSDSSATSKTGGFVGVADADSRINLDYNVDATIGNDAVVLVGNLAKLAASGAVRGKSTSTARGNGFGGDGEGRSDFITDSAHADVSIGERANLEAQEVILKSTVGDVNDNNASWATNITADSDARGGGFYSEGTADATAKYQADNVITVSADAEVTGYRGVDFITSFDDVRTKASAYSRSSGLFGYVSSDTTVQQDLTGLVTGVDNAEIIAGPRIELVTPGLANPDGEFTELSQFNNAKFRLAFYVSTVNGGHTSVDNNARHSKRSLAAGGSDEHGDQNTDFSENIAFDSDVTILSGRSPELDVIRDLVIDDRGFIQKAINVTIDDSAGGGIADLDSGQIQSDLIVVNDIGNPGPGDVAFDSTTMAGSNGVWTFRETLERVRITNASDRDIEINNIDVQSTDRPLVWLNPAKTAPLTFTIHAEVAPTLIEIINTGNSNVIIDGTINNPIGTTSIINTGGGGFGSILSGKDRGVTSPDNRAALIITNILNIDAANDVGSDTERLNVDLVSVAGLPATLDFATSQVSALSNSIFVGQSSKFVDGQLVRYNSTSPDIGLTNGAYYYVQVSDDGLSLKLSLTPDGVAEDLVAGADFSDTHSLTTVEAITVDAVDNIDLDLRALKREGAAAGEYIVNIDRIAAGNTADVLLRNGLHQTSTAGRVGIAVEWDDDPVAGDNNTSAGSNYFEFFFEPDSGSNAYVGPIEGFLGTSPITTTILQTTYDFRGLDRATKDRIIAGLQAGAGTYTTSDENGDIIVTAADTTSGEPQVNVLALTEIYNPGVNYNDGDITVVTDGYIALTEISDHMRVEEIRSTGSDVLLYSPQSIIDANNDDNTNPADVSGRNITMVSASASLNNDAPGFVNPDSADVFTQVSAPVVYDSGLGGGIGETGNYLEINVANADNATGALRAYDAAAVALTDGIFIDEIDGDLRTYIVSTSDSVSLRTKMGSILDANGDDEWAANVIARTIDLDANGGSIGLKANAFEIDSRFDLLTNSSLTLELDDVALEADDDIVVTETEDELRLVLAHSYLGDVILTVREADDTTQNQDLLLIKNGSARFAETNGVQPGTHDDSLRPLPHGLILAEQGYVELRAGDDIATHENSAIVAAEAIDIYGDDNGDLVFADDDYGADIVLRGQIIAGAVMVALGNRVPGAPSTPTGTTRSAPIGTWRPWGTEADILQDGTAAGITRVFGNKDVDLIQFGDTGGSTGMTGWGDDGYIYLGSQTRAYGSADAVTGEYATPDARNDGQDSFVVYYLQDAAAQTSPAIETITYATVPYDTDAIVAGENFDLSVLAMHTLTLDGQSDTDTYEVFTLGSQGDERNYIINILDTGEEDDGVDEAFIYGFDSDLNGVDDPNDDIFLLRAAAFLPGETADRPGYVALLHGTLEGYQDVLPDTFESAEVQRISYDTGLNGRLTIEGQGGNDHFYSDDTTVITTIDGGEGNDVFQIGQIFGENRNEADGNLLAQDVFPDLRPTTRGWLSRGSSAPMLAQGGSGNDEFRVYSNQSELRLEGDDNNDLFIVRAFAIAATTDYDWNEDDTIDVADLDAGVALLEDIAANGEAAFAGRADEVTLKALLSDGGGGYITDRNADGGINYLDVFITVGITQDDVIVVDEDGVASPQIGLGFSVAQAPDIRAGGGQDEVRYNINAPVSVEGGTGFDKLVVLGTEFADDIAITDKGVFGAGLNVRYSTVEVVEVDGLEGDDKFYIRSTAFGVAYRVIGGLGSDIINVAGDVQEDIVTRELEGVSGAADHIVASDDFLYDGSVIDGLDYNVTTDGEGLVVIDEGPDGLTAVREGDASHETDSYTVRLARQLVGDEVVYVTVSAARSPQEEQDGTLPNDGLSGGVGDSMWVSSSGAEGTGISQDDILGVNYLDPANSQVGDDFLREIVLDGTTYYVPNRAVVLKFTKDNWDIPQTVNLLAVDDLRAEGDRVTVVQHSVISNADDYDAIDVRNVEVDVRDNDTPGVLVTEIENGSATIAGGVVTGFTEDGRTLVVEGTLGGTELTDQILVQLQRAPEAGDTIVVKVNLGGLYGDSALTVLTDQAIEMSDGGTGRFDALSGTISFDSTNWDQGVLVTIHAENDDVREDPETAVLGFGQNLAGITADMELSAWSNEDGGPEFAALSLNSGGWIASGFEIGETVSISGVAGITSAEVKGFDKAGLTLILDVDGTGIVTTDLAGVVVTRDAPIGATTIDADGDYVFPNLRSGTGLLDIEVIDNDTAGSVVLESGRDTVLIPDDLSTILDDESVPDTYELRLTKAPTADVNVAVVTDGLANVSSINGVAVTPDDYVEVGGLRAAQVFVGSIVFDDTGANATLTRGTGEDFGSFISEGWDVGDLIRISGAGIADGDFEVLSVSESVLTLVQSDLDPIGPAISMVEVEDDVVLSRLTERDTWSGTVSYTTVDGAPALIRTEAFGAANEDVQGWLKEGFLEGQWVRISDGANEIEAKIAIIRGFNDTQDHTIQFTLDPNADVSAAAWLTDAADDQVTVTRIAANAVFTPTDYYQLQEIELTADPYYEVPTTREGVKIFPVKAHRLSDLRGPLAVEGGPSGADRSLTNGVKLPGEEDSFLIAIGTQPPESQQIDVLNIFNDGSKADTSGVLTETTLSGFGMGSDLVFPNVTGPLFGEGAESETGTTLIFPGGISFGKVNFGANGVTNDTQVSTVEVVNVMLGEGNDLLEVEGTLNPAPAVSAENEFTAIEDWSDSDYQFLYDRTDFEGHLVITRDGFNWKAEGFLVGQTVFAEGIDGSLVELGRIIGIEDAMSYTVDDIDPKTNEPYRDPSDNSLLILSATGLEPGVDFGGSTKLIAEDDDVIELLTVDVLAATAAGATLRWNTNDGTTGATNWADAGFLEGHLLHIGIGDDAREYRIVEFSEDGMDAIVEGAGLEDLTSLSDTFWVQGSHGGLTVLHGGGNLYVDVLGKFNLNTEAGQTEAARLDGRSFAEAGFAIGDLIQLEGESFTRTIVALEDAVAGDYGITPTFDDWGKDSVMVLSAPNDGSVSDYTNVDTVTISAHPENLFLISKVEAKEVTVTIDVTVEISVVPGSTSTEGLETVVTLNDPAQTWSDLGFVAGGVIFIEGYAGAFTIADILEDDRTLVLLDAALGNCGDDHGRATLTITTYDRTMAGEQRKGGDHFIVTGGAGPDSPLVIYGDTSQDGIWYSGNPNDPYGLEFGEKPFDPFPKLPDGQNEDDEFIFAVANPFDLHGHDIIDASALFADDAAAGIYKSVGITAYGGMGDDLIIGSQTGDHLAGGSGDDTIIGQAGTDHIYGDSGFNVNILTRSLTVATIDASPEPTLIEGQPHAEGTFAPYQSPVRDPLGDRVSDTTGLDNIAGAGDDMIIGNGSAHTDNTPDIIFGDHGQVEQLVIDPNQPFALPQKIQTTELSTVIAIVTAEFATGGDDVVLGSELDDILIGGAGNDALDGLEGDDLIFGDNVTLSRMGEIDGNLYDDIASLRFQTLAGTLMYGRTDRAPSDGYGSEVSPGVFEITEDGSGVLMVTLEGGERVARDYRDPNGPGWWNEYSIDYSMFHTFDINDGLAGVGTFGNDFIAGGGGHDQLFGQLGNDIIQGDGTIEGAVAGRGDGTFDGIELPTGYVSAGRDPQGPEDPIGPLKVVAAGIDINGVDGNDYIEGGGGCDIVFGGLGQDDIVGGSSSFFSLINPDLRPDHDDMLFGGTGAADEIARNSAENSDGSTATLSRHASDADVIAGDNADIVRIVGINNTDVLDGTIDLSDPAAFASVYAELYETRGGLYLAFDYDTYNAEDGERIIVRGVSQLDYSPGGPDFLRDDPAAIEGDFITDPAYVGNPNTDLAYKVEGDTWREMFGFWALRDIGGNDEVHGGTGDDVAYLGGGNDIAFGDAENDDIIGGWGNDWISGGTGIDGILGDDGRIFTQRNEGLAGGETFGEAFSEDLYGTLKLLTNDPDRRTSQGNVLNEEIYTPGRVQQETINIEFELVKAVDLTPFDVIDSAINPVSSANPASHNPYFADDVIFGGLGTDYLHGGSGDDAVGGHEAIAEGYILLFGDGETPGIDDVSGDNPDAVAPIGLTRTDFTRPWNPGNILLFGDGDEHWNEPTPTRERTGEFYLYDEYDPRRVILFHDDGTVWKDGSPDGLKQYFLNASDNEGEAVLSYVEFAPNGTPIGDQVAVQSDGNDRIFGDMGNDWIVGGTGKDRIYGGFGNDLMNADDVIGTDISVWDTGAFGSADEADGGLNLTPESHLSWEDRVFGGAGLDILIGNTGGDRLIDHLGEFNSYLVPFAPFGIATVSRQVPPQLWDFLAAQAYSDGVDITRTSDVGAIEQDSRYSNVIQLQGNPHGEIGLVTQRDRGYWQDQSGPPTDPQAGNIPGGRRDILRSADFNDRTTGGFAADQGQFTATGGVMEISANTISDKASAVFLLDDYLPSYYEVEATFNLDKPTGGWKANGYVIFDYYSDVDFKFAGINVSTNKIEMGYVDETGWHYVVQSNKPVQIKPGKNYSVTVAVNGNNVTLAVAGVNWFTYDYVPKIDVYGDPIPLNRGMVGVGMDGSRGRIDNFKVQVLPPDWTLDETDDFSPPVAELPRISQSSGWTESSGTLTGVAAGLAPAVQTVDLGVSLGSNSILEMEVDVKGDGTAGFVFDRYDALNYKFIVLDTANDRVLVGHATDDDGQVIDGTFAFDLNANANDRLKVSIQGAGLGITVNGASVGQFGFNAALVDGAFGLIVLNGEVTFDDFRLATNDEAFNTTLRLAQDSFEALSSETYIEGTLSQAEVESVYDVALEDWVASGLISEEELAFLGEVTLIITDLEGSTLARTVGDDTILIDAMAAGAGWYIESNEEPSTGAIVTSGVDLLTVLRHEIGHILGYQHDQLAIMADELETSTRIEVGEDPTAEPTTVTVTPDNEAAPADTTSRKDTDREAALIFDPVSGSLVEWEDAQQIVASRTANEAGVVALAAATAFARKPLAHKAAAASTVTASAEKGQKRGLLSRLGAALRRSA